MLRTRPLIILLAVLAASLLATGCAQARSHRAGVPRAGVANAGLPGASPMNPLAGLPWGVYTGSNNNGVYPAYQAATGRDRQLLGKIALRPQALWFGAWFHDADAASAAREYIANVTGGNPNVLAQIAVFRMDPWEGQACQHSWSATEKASYRTWVQGFAAGIGSSRVALILQPDMPFAMCASSHVPLELISWSARVFSALPHTTVYVDAGARYFPMPFSSAVRMLEQAGIRYARGFSLNTTEYDSTGAELEYGARLAQALSTDGYGNKHMVISTTENGAPFLNGQYPGDVGNPRVCRSAHDTLCTTLGIPPTTQTASRRWHLSDVDRSLAARYADAYVWAGRPWLDYGSDPFELSRALGLAASSSF